MVRFLITYEEIKSSPTITTSMDEEVTVKPMDGKRRGLRVGRIGIKVKQYA